MALTSRHRAVLIVESPFSARDERRFGVSELQAAGLEVEVWDVGDLTLPNARRQWHEPATAIRPMRVSTMAQLGSLAAGLGAADSVVLLCGVFGEIDIPHASLLEEILGSPAIVGAITVGTIPRAAGVNGLVVSAYWMLKRIRARWRPNYRPSRQLDYIWAGTTVAPVARKLRGKATVLRYVHVLDYDLLLKQSAETEALKNFVLFIDAGGPLHPDYVTLGSRNPWNVTTYCEVASAALSVVEDGGARVVVAAHPRTDPLAITQLYPNSDIVYGDIARYIAASDCVVALEGSTALGLAAVLGKPVMFIDDPRIPDAIGALSGQFRAALGASAINTTHASPGWSVPPVNRRRYARFVARYMKRPGTPAELFWTIVGQDLSQATGARARASQD